MDPVVAFIVGGILVPLLVAEYGELSPALAKRLLAWGARRLGSAEKTERYTEEWLADLENVPGKLSKLGYAIGVVTLGVVRLRDPATAQDWVKPPVPLPFATDSVFGPGHGTATPKPVLLPSPGRQSPPRPAAVGEAAPAWRGSGVAPIGIGSMLAYRRDLDQDRPVARHSGERFFERYADNWGPRDHRSNVRPTGNPEDIFGRPEKTSPSVIGDDPA